MAVIDMRPAKGTLLYELLRLGMVFDHSDDGKSQTWFNYQTSLRADVESLESPVITLTDTTTRLSRQISLDDLKDTESITTWKSDDPTKPTVSNDPVAAESAPNAS